MNNKLIFKSIVSAFIITLFFASCDKDYNEIGTNVVGGDHFDFEKYTDATVVAFNQATGFVQTNNLKLNGLGILNNPVFGNTTASFVTQLQLPSGSVSTFGENVEIGDVYLSVPYFSKVKSTGTDGSTKYELDSIYGKGKIKLSVFESGYFINNYDPSPEANFESELKFYNNDSQLFEANKRGAAADGTSIPNGTRLNNAIAKSENDEFIFDPSEIVVVTPGVDGAADVTTRSVPAMKLRLNSSFFKKKILEASPDKLANNNSFKDYFRGLYFKVEHATGEAGGSLAMMDFTKGTITIAYKEDLKKTDKDGVTTTTRVDKTFVINLGGNKISLLEQSNPGPAYSTAIANNIPDSPKGDEKLFIKGGEGSMAVIDLFGRGASGDGVTDELKSLRDKGWLINEANLTFYVDNASMNNISGDSIPEPQRIYLYDLTNKRQLFDYSTDFTTNSDPKFNKSTFGGLIEREKVKGGRAIKYKIRITNHIRNLIRNDSTNVRLGLVVTESINEVTNVKLKTASTIDRIPSASVMSPLGTILWGTGTTDEDKRLKLEIYYTKPN